MRQYIAIFLLMSVLTMSVLAGTDNNVPVNLPANENAKIVTKENGFTRTDLLHYEKSSVAVSSVSGQCYSNFAEWSNTPVNYVINPSNPQRLSELFVTTAISNAIETWDVATLRDLSNPYTIDYSATWGVNDGKNSIVFGRYISPGVIAVTGTWTNDATGEIVDSDILFNLNFKWGDATIKPQVMDLQNIATHELGHTIGLDDIYSSSCSDVTMYGYSSKGETKKRTLETPDITVLNLLYP